MMAFSSTPAFSRLCAECPIDSFCHTGDEERAALHVRQGFHLCRKGRSIYRQGDTGGEVYILRDGWAFRYVMLPDGRRQILDFVLRGDAMLLPLLFVPRLPYAVQALTDSVLCAFSVDEVKDACRANPAFARRLETACVIALVLAESRLADIGQRTAPERTAWLLLSHYRELKSRGLAEGKIVPFPLRLSHIADALGLTVTHVSRTLGAFKRQGMVSLSNDRLTVHNEKELAAVAVLPPLQA